MRFTSETSSGGVLEQLFALGEISGALWMPQGAAGTPANPDGDTATTRRSGSVPGRRDKRTLPGDPVCLQRNRNSLPAARSYADGMAERANVYPLRRELKPEPRPQRPLPAEPLWREVLGQRLHTLRSDRQETLSETAGRAGISPQYLSEIERGRKEPSSEMIAALAGALGITLTGLTEQVAGDLRRQYGIVVTDQSGPVMLARAA